MSRILDSMKTRVGKIQDKIKPLVDERDNLLQAIALLESSEKSVSSPEPATDTVQATLPEPSKTEVPAFLKGHKTEA